MARIGTDNADRGADAVSPRSTRQRRAIEAAMSGFDDFRSVQDIYEAMRRAGELVGLSTVYRGVQRLVEVGKIDVIKTDSGESIYRRCSDTHHHHLICRDCGRTVEIQGPAVEGWAASVSAQFGYVDVDHTIELFGRCTDCRPALTTRVQG